MCEINFEYRHESYRAPVVLFNMNGHELRGVSAVLDTGCVQSSLLINDDLLSNLITHDYLRKTKQCPITVIGVGGIVECEMYYAPRIAIGNVLMTDCCIPVDVLQGYNRNPEFLFGVDLINKCIDINYCSEEYFRLQYKESSYTFNKDCQLGLSPVSSF